MLLALDIGNTNIHVGLFEGDALRHSFCIGADPARTADEYALLLSALGNSCACPINGITEAIVGSVVPGLTQVLTDAVARIVPVRVTVVGPGVKTGFALRLDDPSELGADLAANAAGALGQFGAPVLIVDCGTATTVSALDADGAFVGCAIRPGIRMSLDALHNTGLLPGVVAEAPLHPVGKNSTEAIRIGVIRGEAIAVEGFLAAFRRELKLPDATPVVLTGGHANLIQPLLSTDLHFRPHLTLQGLARIAALNAKRRR